MSDKNALSELIVKKVQLLGYNDVKTTIEAATVKGDNFLGIIHKATTTATGKDGPKTLNWIVKCASETQPFRDVMQLGNLFGREMFVYEKVLPAYIDLQKDLNIENPFNNFTAIHLTSNSIPEIIAMEDMKNLGYEMRDRFQPLDYEHVMLVLKEYGRFHALSFALQTKKPNLFAELAKDLNENFFTTMNPLKMQHNLDQQNGKVMGAFKKYDVLASKKFKEYAECPFPKIVESLQAKTSGKYSVIGHGDSWVNNILFKYENKSKPTSPTKLCLIDFQLTRLGSPALDLSYFIFTCTDKKLRDSHYEEMLKTYYASLSTFLNEMSCDVNDIFPYSVLLEHMKKFSMYGLMMTIMVSHLMLSDTEEIPDLEKTNVDGTMDLDSAFGFESKNEEAYHGRMREVILDFVAKEYI